MRKTSEYRRHRDECRALARKAENDEQRSELLKMAEIWDMLAQEQERMTVMALAQPEPSFRAVSLH